MVQKLTPSQETPVTIIVIATLQDDQNHHGLVYRLLRHRARPAEKTGIAISSAQSGAGCLSPRAVN